MKLTFAFTEEDFITACVDKLQRDGSTVSEDIFGVLTKFLANPVANSVTQGEAITSFVFDYYDDALSLQDYIEAGSLGFPYLKLTIYGDCGADLDINTVELPSFLSLDEYRFGVNGLQAFKVKQNHLKTKSKAEIKFNCLRLSATILKKIKDQLTNSQRKLLPSKLDVYEWRQTFYDKVSGDSYLCECFRDVVSSNPSHAQHLHLKRALSKSAYRCGICHLCTGENSSLTFSNPMYGSVFKARYGGYITKVSLEQKIDEREAENIVREIKGVAKIGERWINETLLYNYIKLLFPNHLVEREATPPWLGKQRLDVYIPALRLAVEYQGKQHYEPIPHFGGEEGFARAQERDKQKAKFCKQNNVDLVYFTYKENLTEKLVDKRLQKYVDREITN